ncbi:MAG: hypothetical protein ACYTEZ_14580 [Planctomycetota bacterium]|jgi:hypothetical protein
MRLSVRGLAAAGGLLWGLVLLLVGLANLIWTGYGQEFLQLMASLYPGYKATAGVDQVVVGMLYAFVDGAAFGAVLAFLYNKLAGVGSGAAA